VTLSSPSDVMDLRPSDFDTDFDVVLASPPCTDFSMAASRYEKVVDGEPQTESARFSVALVYHTIGLIKALTPSYWFMENPRGYLRQIIGEPTATVTYCQYGTDYMKPTDLWGDHPVMEYRSCNTGQDCHEYNTSGDNGGLGNCDVIGDNAAERSLVPYDLSEAIRDACERALNGEAVEQTALQDGWGE